MPIIITDGSGNLWSISVDSQGRVTTTPAAAGAIVTGQYSTVQSIVNKVAQDVRFQLQPTGTEATILIDYTNRIHKDVLRRIRWTFLLSPVQTFLTIPGYTDYQIGIDTPANGVIQTSLWIGDLGEIKTGNVFDRTNDKPLFPTLNAPLMGIFSVPDYPKLYRNDPSTPEVISIYPPPSGVFQIEFRYFRARAVLAQLTDQLQTPPDYDDVIVAGVNGLAYQFMKNDQERAQFWSNEYERLKREMVRDTQAYPKGPDFISPDPATQVRGTSWGYPDDLASVDTTMPSQPILSAPPTWTWYGYSADTLVPTGQSVGVRANGGTTGITLTIQGEEGEQLVVVDIGNNGGPVTLADSNNALIGTNATYVLSTIGQSVALFFTGGQWWIQG